MRRRRPISIVVAILAWAASLGATSVQAAGPIQTTRGGALPTSAENTLSSSFPCIGRLIDQAPGPPVLLTLRNFDDGTVPVGQNGPLNDRGYISAAYAVSNLRTDKVQATVEGDDQKRALAALAGRKDMIVVTLDATFNAFDQRTEDRSKSFDFFLFNIQGLGAVDESYSSLHLTGIMTANGMALPGGGFRHKAILLNKSSRFTISVFSDDADLGATFARASFQAVGDIEELLIDLAVLTAVQRLFDIDISACLNGPAGADAWSTADALFDRMSDRERRDEAIAALFRTGYLAHPTIDYDGAVSDAMRRFQSRYGLPPDGLPNKPSLTALKRAVAAGEKLTSGIDVFDAQLGRALEAGRTNGRFEWRQDQLSGAITIHQTWENYRSTGRPCRSYSYVVTFADRRFAKPDGIACRLSENVWAPINP